jgi:LemA protein
MMTFALGLIVLVVLFFIFVIGLYNNLVKLRQQQRNAFSQIDVQLTRRYEVIPNLVEVAKTYMKHEQDTLEKVIQARNSAWAAKKAVNQDPGSSEAMTNLIAAENSVKGQLGSLMAISESYPELRSNETMKSLMEELASTDNKVSFARQSYNDMTTDYNTALEVFPSSIVANMFNFSSAALYEVEDQKARAAVKVKFD